jgi:transcriptional regulator with XRE-family HTH domain
VTKRRSERQIRRGIAKRISDARAEAGLTQTALATACGVSQPAVVAWERGSRLPSAIVIIRLADALGVETGWLLA